MTSSLVRPRPRRRVAVLLTVAIVVALGAWQLFTPSSGTSSLALPSLDVHGSVGIDDGVVPDGVTVFADHVPAVARLDPRLLDALRRAGRDASAIGFDLMVTSGWRSAAYQERLFRRAVAEYGSESAAQTWVARPGTSVHESGDAVDLGPAAATDWLRDHGAAYGLCPVYANEPWHYELRPQAVRGGCPQLYADPTHDPRMHR